MIPLHGEAVVPKEFLALEDPIIHQPTETLQLVADQIWGNQTHDGEGAAVLVSQGCDCLAAPAPGCWDNLA